MELTERSEIESRGDDAPSTNARSPPNVQHALPPTDEGLRAWIALFGSFSSNALIWGFALSFGVLQEYYISNEPFNRHPAGIAAIGTTATGVMYLTMPLYLTVFQRWPRARRWSLSLSLPMTAISLIGASYAETVPQLLVCQGLVYAIAGNALVTPNLSYLNEWFARKRGLAIGISIAGDGVGGAVMPLILQALLNRLGFRWTLRVVAVMIIGLSAPLPFLLRPRLPVSAARIAPRIDTSFLRHRLFWILQLFNVVQALGYFLPLNYLPSIAEAIGLSSTLGSLTVLLVNAGLIVGCLAVGALVDRFDVTAVTSIVSTLAACSVFLALGFSVSIAPLFIFSALYGLTASAYSTNWGGIIKEIQRQHEGTDANMVFGLLAAGRGVGSIISGPLSEALLVENSVRRVGVTSAYETEYARIIIFAGTTAALGGCSWFVRRTGII